MNDGAWLAIAMAIVINNHGGPYGFGNGKGDTSNKVAFVVVIVVVVFLVVVVIAVVDIVVVIVVETSIINQVVFWSTA